MHQAVPCGQRLHRKRRAFLERPRLPQRTQETHIRVQCRRIAAEPGEPDTRMPVCRCRPQRLRDGLRRCRLRCSRGPARPRHSSSRVRHVPAGMRRLPACGGPIASITPANSRPGTNGPFGVAEYRPRQAKMSAKFRPMAWTATRASPGPGGASGSGTGAGDRATRRDRCARPDGIRAWAVGVLLPPGLKSRLHIGRSARRCRLLLSAGTEAPAPHGRSATARPAYPTALPPTAYHLPPTAYRPPPSTAYRPPSRENSRLRDPTVRRAWGPAWASRYLCH